MKYEIITLEKRRIRGIKARTSNSDPQMSAIIGGLWQEFFQKKNPFIMEGRTTETLTGLYSDYESDENGSYDITIGCQVEDLNPAQAAQQDKSAEFVPESPGPAVGSKDAVTGRAELVDKIIPAGTYARFTLQGDQREQVAALWQEIWAMDLKRTFTGDFEEYFSGPDGGPDELHIYIAVADQA